MKIKIHITAVVIVLSVLVVFQDRSFAQKAAPVVLADAGTFDTSSSDLETQLVSLDSITKIALKHSPYLKYDSAMLEAKEQDMMYVKRKWQNHLSGFVNYSRGNTGFLTTGSASDAQNNLFSGYRYGVNLTIPLSEFTTRKFSIRKTEAELNAAEYRKEQTEMELKSRVIADYNNLLMAQKILKIKGSGKENSLVLQQLAERQFREGTTTLEEYASVSDMAVRAEVDFELAKSNFKTLYLQFENLIGVRLTTLMKKK